MGRTSDAKERLINTAMSLVRGGSYNAVSVDDLCRNADVRKGSFYHFFPSKQHLVLATLDAWWENISREVIQPSEKNNNSPIERIQQFFERATKQQFRNAKAYGQFVGCPFGTLAMELATQDEDIRIKLDEIFSRFTGYFESTLKEAVDKGEIPHHDLAITAKALLAQLYGTILLAKAGNDPKRMSNLPTDAMRLIPRENA